MYADSTSYESSGRWADFLQRHGPTWLCAAAGFLSAFTVSVVGQMPVGEIILVALFPWVMIKAYFRRGWAGRIQQLGWYRLLVTLAAVTVLGYVVSDVFRATPYENLIRGWARVGFLVVDLVAIAHLIDFSWSRLWAFILALSVGGVVNAMIDGPLYGEWWKFGFGYCVSAVVLFSVAGRGAFLQITVALVLGLANLALGARSLGATCLLTAGLFGLAYVRGIWRPLALLGSIAFTSALLVAANLLFLEDQDHTGSNIERQSMIETATEVFVESPLVGQGSWFTATSSIRRLEERRRALESSFRGYTEEEARKLAIHSQVLVALAEGGILGGAFFLGLGVLVLKTLRTLTQIAVPHRAFVLYLVLAGGWNLLMSPFSGVARVEIVLLVCACLLVILQRQEELAEDFRE